MEPSLTAYKAEFGGQLLDLLWRQWTGLGVSGHGAGWTRTPLDPEALILVSCTVARRDARLFDAMLDWLHVNGRYVNVHRLHRVLKAVSFVGGEVFGAVAAATGVGDRTAQRSRGSRQNRTRTAPSAGHLFSMADGAPLPVVREPDTRFLAHGFLRDRYEPRHAATAFRPDTGAGLLLRLRALLGMNARCEILVYLLLNQRGSPRAVARACSYYPATVSKALADMADSGYVTSHAEGRHRYYSLIPDAWRTLLLGTASPPRWIAWPALFSALERLWLFLEAPERPGQSPLAQASALRRVLQDGVIASLGVNRLPTAFGGWQRHTGASLLPFFIGEMQEVLEAVHGLG